MLSSLFSGISGLLANGQSLNVVGNNIANVNTIGYKESRAIFEDVLYQSIQGASGTSQVGRGVALSSVDTLFSQGSFETTSEATDLAIGGKGFFIVKSDSTNQLYYTRAGEFRFDKSGKLTNPSGYVLQGKAIDPTSKSPSGVSTDIVISAEPSLPKTTSLVGMAVNLQSNATWAGQIGSITTTTGTAANIAAVGSSSGKYPRAGAYTMTTAVRTAATITGTGTNAADLGTAGMAGTLKINGTSIDVTGITTLTGLISAIKAKSATTGVTASDNGGGTGSSGTKLVLTATSNGKDIVVDDSMVTQGGIGWTSDDKASSTLYGASLSLQITPEEIPGQAAPAAYTVTGNIPSTSGSLTNWTGKSGTETVQTGLDLTYTGNITSGGTQNLTISGFTPTTKSTTVNPSTTSNYSSSITVYDSLGQSHVVNVYFRKSYETQGSTPTSVWEWHAQLNAADSASKVDTDVAAGYLTFNNQGTLISGGDKVRVNFDFSSGKLQQPVDLIFGSSSGGGAATQYPIASTTNFQTQDGYPPGVLQNVSVDTTGVISGHYSNGQILDLYQLTLANFNNPQGLTRDGGNLFSETLESGVAYTNAPGSGGLGSINPNSLEQSNVDLATEFVKMITAQRGFQANSRVITTTDEVLQELMQLKR